MSARPEDVFDFKDPDYPSIFAARTARLKWIREDPQRATDLLAHYKSHIADFITDWGVTLDPRNVSKNRPAFLPFILQPKQREAVDQIIAWWHANESGLIEKSRDQGMSWIAMATAICLAITHNNFTAGFGSANETKLDRSGDPDSLFYKGRMFVANLPVEFRGGCDVKKHAPDKRILIPSTDSSITGEVGDNIGLGGRKSIYFVDESCFIEHPKLMESSLSGNTDCRIDISSLSLDGMANEFAIRRHSGRVKVFTLHYRDDLRRDAEWIEKKKASLDPVIWAANYEIDYTGAAEGVCVPQQWVLSAVDAHKKIKMAVEGIRRGALDVADLGKDKNAFAARHGPLVLFCDVWSGKESGDIFATTERAFTLCDDNKLEGFRYDANAIGSGVRGDASRIAKRREKGGQPERYVHEFLSGNAVYMPDLVVMGTDRKAKDMFYNLRAQGAWHLRMLFQQTHRAVSGLEYDPDYLISLDSTMPELQKLCIEISQPKWKIAQTNGKMLVDKQPDGIASPNRFDALLMCFCPMNEPMKIDDSILEEEDGPMDWEVEFANE